MGNGFPAYGRRLPIGWDFCMPAFVDFHPKHRLFQKKMSVLDSTLTLFLDKKLFVVVLYPQMLFYLSTWSIQRFAFVASKKKVTCLALEFSKESRGLKDWEVVE